MYNKNINMNNEFLKMQKLAGLITEGQYKAKLNENESSSFKIGQEVIYADENPNELKKILDISSYEDNQDEIDADIEEFGWEQQSETPKEDLTWYKLDFGDYTMWTDNEELESHQDDSLTYN
jgi:hypothetical protein